MPESDAPVKASLEAVIQATPEKVWSILTDINHWPKWQTNLTESHIEGPLQSGTKFTWRTGSIRKLLLCTSISSYPRPAGLSMPMPFHIWRLQPLPNNTTLVKTDESMSGSLLTLFYSSKDLQESDRFWLDCLERESERRPAISN
jgi:polyketide cyclase/dehydrase/lipid transport protein